MLFLAGAFWRWGFSSDDFDGVVADGPRGATGRKLDPFFLAKLNQERL